MINNPLGLIVFYIFYTVGTQLQKFQLTTGCGLFRIMIIRRFNPNKKKGPQN